MAEHVPVSLTRETRDRVRTLTFALTGVTGRRVTMSEAVTAACEIAEQLTPDQLAEHLPGQETRT